MKFLDPRLTFISSQYNINLIVHLPYVFIKISIYCFCLNVYFINATPSTPFSLLKAAYQFNLYFHIFFSIPSIKTSLTAPVPLAVAEGSFLCFISFYHFDPAESFSMTPERLLVKWIRYWSLSSSLFPGEFHATFNARHGDILINCLQWRQHF